MITVICGLLIFTGLSLMCYHIVVPVTVADWQSGMVTANNIIGLVLVLVGLIIVFVRLRQTGVGCLLNLPNEDNIKSFFQPGHSNNTRILEGKLLDNNIIKTKNKLIHYKGGGFRIAGHECIRVHGNVVSNIPEWLGEVIAEYREKYKVNNIYQLQTLYDKLQKLNTTDDAYEQLKDISELSHITEDKEKFKEFCNIPIKDIKSLAETLWDGTTIRFDVDIDEFIQTATPAQVRQYAQKEYMSLKNRDQMLKQEGSRDLLKYAIPIGILMFLAALGAGIFLQMGG